MVIRVNNITKFQLLLWKNWLIIKNHRGQLILELILPVICSFLVIYLRYMVHPQHESRIFFSEFPIDSISRDYITAKPEVLYSPKNPYLENIVSKAVDSLQLEKFYALPNAKSLENKLIDSDFLAGIEFDDKLSNIKSYPKKLSFTLRFPRELRVKMYLEDNTWQTDIILPKNVVSVPRYPRQINGGSPNYILEGFIALQNAISMSYLKLAGNVDLPPIVMQRYPYPAYIQDNALEGLSFFLALILMTSLMFPLISLARAITDEKEKQLKEVMKMMGLQNWLHWSAWFVRSVVVWTISLLLVLILYKIKWTSDVAVLTYSSWMVLFLFLLIYLITGICFCFMLAVFFSKANVAGIFVGLAWFSTFVPYFSMGIGGITHYWRQLGWSVMPNTAMAVGMHSIIRYEKVGEGVQWGNLFSTVKPDNISLGTVMVILAIEAIIYMIICVYIEQVFPGQYGVPEKWNFPFTRDFWCRNKRNAYKNIDEEKSHDTIKRSDSEGFEEAPEGKNVGIKVKDLKKKFGDKWAVKGLTMNMYEDEITVLLGDNGAGKTTTISMLVGMFPPTSGSVIINGKDIRTNVKGARSSLGICPQHNVLFDAISVANHIAFFSRLKGLKGDAVQKEVNKYLEMIELENKANTPAAKLSGGMKRKLSICCALCGGTKVVLCDEPTSGMDPAARRQLWDLLQAEKVGRTLLLTTHYMDEADVLGDRIAIMSDGKLMCYGTPFFLKKMFGSGYILICEKREDCNVSEVTKLLDKYIPGIQPVSDVGAELTYELPGDMSRNFEKMFSELENQSNKLGLNGYGISITSLEEVFFKVGNKKSANFKRDTEMKTSYDFFAENTTRNFRMKHYARQWEAMFFKKRLFVCRDKIGFLLRHIFVISMIIFCVKGGRYKFSELPPMTISLTQYPTAVAVLEVTPDVKADSLESRISKAYKSIINSYGKNYKFESTGRSTFSNYILGLKKSQWHIDSRYLAAATISSKKITAWLNSQMLHTAPLTLNLVHNAMAKAVLGSNAEIRVTNHPLPGSGQDFSYQLQMQEGLGLQVAGMIDFCMAIVSALYVFLPIKERVTRSKLLQFVSGVRIWTFWLTQYLWDIMTLTFTALAIVFTLAFFREKGYSSFDELIRVFGMLMIFGLAILPCSYFIGFLFNEPAKGFAIVLVINFITGKAFSYIVQSVYNLEQKSTAEVLMWFLPVFPHFALESSLVDLHQISVTTSFCRPLHNSVYCLIVPECCDIPGYYSFAQPGNLMEIISLLFVGLLCFVFVVLIEYRVCHRRSIEMDSGSMEQTYENVDENVAAEKKRILAMSKREINEYYLVLDRLTKYYNNFPAVNQISLCVKQKECFGLLGVNGAGKTTTFKMLTGDLSISSGFAYVKGISLLNDLNSVYREIGYCPQFDALIDDFTGREILRLYCLLRGVPKNRIRGYSEELAKLFGFLQYIDKRTKTYSGGNKRKLSMAIAVLGNPSVIYLDEPTAGMDPAARRQTWNMVSRIREAGKCIVLTSHSMEECEALCTRLAIMVNGELMCIGSVQHLKNKFSKGLILNVKVKRPTDPTDLNEGLKRKSSSEDEMKFDTDKSSPRESDKLPPQKNDKGVQTLISSSKSQKRDKSVQTSISYSKKLKRRFELEEKESSKQENERAVQVESKKEENVNIFNEDEKKVERKPKQNLPSDLLADIQRVKEAVKNKYPLSILQEEYQRTLTFYVPLIDIKWSEIFGFMERNRAELRIEDYSISQTTLEEIFLEFAKHQRMDTRPTSQNNLEMDKVVKFCEPGRVFAKDSIRLVKRCTKPDRKEFQKIAIATAIGFCIMGFIGFFVKLIHIPINNIIVGS